METLDLGVKRTAVVVSYQRVGIMGGDRSFCQNFMSENGVPIILGCELSPKKYGTRKPVMR